MSKHNPLPSAELLCELFEYRPLTGELVWKVSPSNSIKVGQVAGCIKEKGYRIIRVEGTPYRAHRLIWMMYYGEDPADLSIDHINTDKADNRIDNLRLATHQDQQRYQPNAVGAYLHKPNGRYRARIRIDGTLKSLGYYDTAEEASAVYHKKAQELYGEFYYEPDADVA